MFPISDIFKAHAYIIRYFTLRVTEYTDSYITMFMYKHCTDF